MVNRPYKVGDKIKSNGVRFTIDDVVEAGLTNIKKKSSGYEATLL